MNLTDINREKFLKEIIHALKMNNNDVWVLAAIIMTGYIVISIAASLLGSEVRSLKTQAIQYGYAHYAGENQKWEWIKPGEQK